MARAKSRAPSERQYPTVYITWKLLYILATSFCKVQLLVRLGRGSPPPSPTGPCCAPNWLTWTSISSSSIWHWEAFRHDCPWGPRTHCPLGPHLL